MTAQILLLVLLNPRFGVRFFVSSKYYARNEKEKAGFSLSSAGDKSAGIEDTPEKASIFFLTGPYKRDIKETDIDFLVFCVFEEKNGY